MKPDMKNLYDFYFSQTQKDMQDTLSYFDDKPLTFIRGIEYTECATHGTDMREHSNIDDYVFIGTFSEEEIEFR